MLACAADDAGGWPLLLPFEGLPFVLAADAIPAALKNKTGCEAVSSKGLLTGGQTSRALHHSPSCCDAAPAAVTSISCRLLSAWDMTCTLLGLNRGPVHAAAVVVCAAGGWWDLLLCAAAAPAHNRCVGMLLQLLLLLQALRSPEKSLIMQLLALIAAFWHSSCMHYNSACGWLLLGAGCAEERQQQTMRVRALYAVPGPGTPTLENNSF